MKKRLFLTGALTFCLLMPATQAKAQGWPTFDVAKLASLITNLVGRFQPVPQVLSRVNQVKSTLAQVQAVGQAAVAGDMKSVGKAAAGALKSTKKSKLEQAADGSNGAADASKKVKDTLFSEDGSNQENNQKVREERKAMAREARTEMASRSYYMAMNAPKLSAERFEKADKAMKDAGTIQDSVNANTMMIMAGNYERLNQISMLLADMKYQAAVKISMMPSSSYKKPKPAKYDDGSAIEEKDEIDVNFE